MSKNKHPVKYVKVTVLQNSGIDFSQFGNAGPNANATGMRQNFGYVYMIKSGKWLYNVPKEVYDLF